MLGAMPIAKKKPAGEGGLAVKAISSDWSGRRFQRALVNLGVELGGRRLIGQQLGERLRECFEHVVVRHLEELRNRDLNPVVAVAVLAMVDDSDASAVFSGERGEVKGRALSRMKRKVVLKLVQCRLLKPGARLRR